MIHVRKRPDEVPLYNKLENSCEERADEVHTRLCERILLFNFRFYFIIFKYDIAYCYLK